MTRLSKIVVGVIFILIPVIGIIVFMSRPGTVEIRSESGAEIYVATEKGGEFNKIGTSSAVYKSSKDSSSVYIMTTKDSKKTISGVQIEKGKTQKITLDLQEKVAATKISNGSVFNAYVSGQNIQGITPEQFTLVNYSNNPEETIKPGFARLPFLKKIVWYDANNFIYNSFRNGVGRYINSNPVGKDGLGDSIYGENIDGIIAGEVDLGDISKTDQQPLVLMSETNMFTSSDMGSSIASIASFEPIKDGENHTLFTTNEHIYRLAGLDPASYASESESEESDGHGHASTLTQYRYDGVKSNSFDLEIDTTDIKALTEKNKIIYILTGEKLITIKDNVISDLDLYFTYARDLTLYSGKIVLLGDDGVWVVNDTGSSAHLLFEYPDSGVGLAQSFSLSGNSLIFGTQAKPGSTAQAKMFSITF